MRDLDPRNLGFCFETLLLCKSSFINFSGGGGEESKAAPELGAAPRDNNNNGTKPDRRLKFMEVVLWWLVAATELVIDEDFLDVFAPGVV